MILLKKILSILKNILIAYAILFSISVTIALAAGAYLVTRPFVHVKALITQNPQETSYMRTHRLRLQSAKEPDSLIQRFVPLDSISKSLIQAVLASEDDAFYIHPGFDVNAMLAAFERNRARGKIRHGGSTITQQLAKNLFLSNERTFNRKYMELIYTLLLEKYLGKDRILELYLNYAQWGKNLFGCEAAAQTFFRKSSNRLTLGESMRLAAVLAKPEKLNPATSNNGFMSERMAVMANNLYLHRQLSDSDYLQLTGTLPPKDSTDTTTTDAESSPAEIPQ